MVDAPKSKPERSLKILFTNFKFMDPINTTNSQPSTVTAPVVAPITAPVGSPSFTLNGVDLKKIGIGLIIVSGGAALTYLTQFVGNISLFIHYGRFALDLSPAEVMVFSTLINLARKWITDHTLPQT